MSDSTGILHMAVAPARHMTRREFRHRAGDCGRLLFVGYLPPGTHIEIRCPACGRIHVIHVEPAGPAIVDMEQQFG